MKHKELDVLSMKVKNNHKIEHQAFKKKKRGWE